MLLKKKKFRILIFFSPIVLSSIFNPHFQGEPGLHSLTCLKGMMPGTSWGWRGWGGWGRGGEIIDRAYSLKPSQSSLGRPEGQRDLSPLFMDEGQTHLEVLTRVSIWPSETLSS